MKHGDAVLEFGIHVAETCHIFAKAFVEFVDDKAKTKLPCTATSHYSGSGYGSPAVGARTEGRGGQQTCPRHKTYEPRSKLPGGYYSNSLATYSLGRGKLRTKPPKTH